MLTGHCKPRVAVLQWRAYNIDVSGLSAVEVQMVNGERFRIGTDDAEGLAMLSKKRGDPGRRKVTLT
jgi:hypothetical protein